MEKNKKSFLKNTIVVLISNVIALLSGVMIGFIIPRIMGVSEYGYYKTFTLYSSYISLLHFGFIDGIYLKYAGCKYESLDKTKFRCYTLFLFGFEAIITLLVLIPPLFFLKSDYSLVVLFICLNILATIISGYFELISQATMRFGRTALRHVVKSALNVVSVLILLLLYLFNGLVVYSYIYIAVVLTINYSVAAWYAITYKDIIFGKRASFSSIKGDLFLFFKIGLPLLLSNLIAQIVFIVDQQFVNVAFDNETYSVYAFAYNMISLITIATSAVATVLYPTLRTLNKESIANNYSKLNTYLLVFVSVCLSSYYPLVFVVEHFLPDYIGSLDVLRIILPGVLISSSISVVKYNCYKTFGKINNYFFKALFVLALSVVADLCVYFVFKNTLSISMISIAVLLVWYFLVEHYFIKEHRVAWVRNALFIFVVLAAFYGISFVPNIYVGFGLYLCFSIAASFFFFKKTITDFLKSIRKKDDSSNVTN